MASTCRAGDGAVFRLRPATALLPPFFRAVTFFCLAFEVDRLPRSSRAVDFPPRPFVPAVTFCCRPAAFFASTPVPVVTRLLRPVDGFVALARLLSLVRTVDFFATAGLPALPLRTPALALAVLPLAAAPFFVGATVAVFLPAVGLRAAAGFALALAGCFFTVAAAVLTGRFLSLAAAEAASGQIRARAQQIATKKRHQSGGVPARTGDRPTGIAGQCRPGSILIARLPRAVRFSGRPCR
ncbi:hypothetical protein [uncultured Desulfobulbus sp.]|uniref:hypothetical protein n=1 Tax=uncultured Desulfobulbus sp. TaxID=239745 RepID=UPI0026075A42|nr:hypothetical protein [uncultured Desulfobulbus sp.]